MRREGGRGWGPHRVGRQPEAQLRGPRHADPVGGSTQVREASPAGEGKMPVVAAHSMLPVNLTLATLLVLGLCIASSAANAWTHPTGKGQRLVISNPLQQRARTINFERVTHSGAGGTL